VIVTEAEDKYPLKPVKGSAILRIRLEGKDAELGRVPAADVAQLTVSVEKALTRAASVAIGRPSRKPGRRERVVANATHLLLRGVEPGSVVQVLEIPRLDDADLLQQSIDISVAQLGEIAAEQLLDVLSHKIDGHPYVVEGLADLGTKLGVGEQYEAVGFDITGSVVKHQRAELDGPETRRLRDRVKADKAAAKEGLLVGTLVEADFEAFRARLRSPEGRAVAVSFDPSMADEIHQALREPATVEGWITYDPVDQAARAINPRRVMHGDQLALGIDARAFTRRRSFAQLQREQHVTGLIDAAELYDSESPEDELNLYDAALQRLADA
jgi:hypothetical protein